MTSRASSRNRSGFTLVEVLVSLFLLTVGILAAASTLMATFKGQRYSASLTTATTLAQSKMETLKAQGYSSAASASEGFGTITGYTTFRRVTTVTPNADDTLKTVTVLVTCQTGQSITLETLIARK